MAKIIENNQIKAATATETAMAIETAMVTVTTAVVMQRWRHIAGVVCLMRKQYFGWGGDW
jgi:hypothetical protein